jgi:hypothetical protein
MTESRIDGAQAFDYKAFLHEPGKAQGRGGNTTALHRHVLTIDGTDYGFFARGAQKWAFKGDTVSFAFAPVDKGGKTSFEVDAASFETTDAKGQPVRRGNRVAKPVARAA